tara:strand:- start:11 stop:454 length:444 start_codon:yes stop_codon:yes gene_type:complete
VEATFRESRKIVAISSTEGNEENSRELSVNNATKRMSTPIVILNARSKSRTTSGRGTTIIRSIDITPAARTTSDFLTKLLRGMLAAATGHPLPRRSLKKTAFQNRNARMGLLQIMLQKHILKIITVILTGLDFSETVPLKLYLFRRR